MRTFLALSLALTLGGCTMDEIQTTAPRDVRRVPASAVNGSFVQAGTMFRARLDDPIGTQLSKRGDAFTATVVEPLVDAHGTVIVDRGAKLEGRIADLDSGSSTPTIRLRFTGIHPANGGASIPLAARIVRIQHTDYAGASSTPIYTADPSSVGDPFISYDTILMSPEGTAAIYPTEIEVPMGSAMTLELTRPLLAPGATWAAP